MNVYNEDYRTTIPKLSNIKMVITSPPDPCEIGLKPDDPAYGKFLKDFCTNISIVSNLICVIITDRKHDGIIPKHSDIIQNFKGEGFRLLSHKIWMKSDKIDLFRLTYSHIMVFADGKIKQKHNTEYKYDVWNIPREKYDGYSNAFPIELIKRIVRNFTDVGNNIYDPFMGSGTTYIASTAENRVCVGSELDEETYKLCVKRVGDT